MSDFGKREEGDVSEFQLEVLHMIKFPQTKNDLLIKIEHSSSIQMSTPVANMEPCCKKDDIFGM